MGGMLGMVHLGYTHHGRHAGYGTPWVYTTMVPGRHAGCCTCYIHGTREAGWVCYKVNNEARTIGRLWERG